MARRKPRDNHHRKPKSLGGSDEPSNLVRVTKEKHQAWHLLFANSTPDEIARIVNEIWLDPDYEFVVYSKRQRLVA